MPAGARVVLESPGSSEMNEEDESPEMDMDYLDEYDSEEERKQKKKKKVDISCMCVPYAQVAQCGLPLSTLAELQSSEAGHILHFKELSRTGQAFCLQMYITVNECDMTAPA